jgi:hypothetical protein
MLKQTITWTALPKAVDGPPNPGATVHLSVFIAPRLWNDQGITKMKLSQFPDFLDWPNVITQTRFKVAFDGGPTIDAAIESAAPESKLWGALFKTGTDVIPFAFEDLSGAQILTFSAVDAHRAIVDTYQTAATSYGAGNRLPSTDELAGDPNLNDVRNPVRPEPPYDPGDQGRQPVPIDQGKPPQPPPGCLLWLLLPFKALVSLVKKILKFLGIPVALAFLPFMVLPFMALSVGLRRSPGGGGGGGISAKKQALDDIRAYVAPTSETSEKLPTESDMDDNFDFHKMVASLGDYPQMLRRMGLVVDLAIKIPVGGLPATGKVHVQVTPQLAMPTTNHAPSTHYELSDRRFVAKPRDPGRDLANGLLRLQDTTRFHVHQVDVVGSAVKLQNTATNVVGLRAIGQEPVNSPEEQGLPALQTAGISIVRPDVRSRLAEIFQRMYALNRHLAFLDGLPETPLAAGGPSPARTDEVFAEDVVRGYRIDVRDVDKKGWLSLCRRKGTYEFLDLVVADRTQVEEDEGFVQIGVTETVQRSPARTLRAHETLFTWDGWSLAAPRPGDAILPDMGPVDDEHPDGTTQHGVVPNTVATPFRLEVTFHALPGSLPRLRYGHRYRVRARMVDLAGNSVFNPDEPAFAQDQPEVTAEFMFRRFEPIGPPPVLLRELPKEGESLERLTVRSAVGDPPAHIRTQATERHLAPPKGAQLLAERHEHFDTPAAIESSPAAYDRASREAGSLTHRLDTGSNELVLIDGVVEERDDDLHRSYWRQKNASYDVSYLPDPFARGILLRGLPGMGGLDDVQDGVNRLPFDGGWPALRPLRLRLHGLPAGEASPIPDWDAANRVLTVGLAQGQTAEVLIASYFHEADLETMGVWDWTVQAGPINLADLKMAAVEGRNWLHLPYRTLTLVHAIQQPLTVPTIQAFDPPTRGGGDTAVILNGTLAVDGKSTGKVDVWASWSDPIDAFDDPAKAAIDPSSPAALVHQKMHVRDLILPDPDDDNPTLLGAVKGMLDKTVVVAPTGLQHTIGDTKYHKVDYSLIGTTRFREHFPSGVVSDPNNLIQPRPGQPEVPTPLDIPSSSRPAPARVRSTLPIFRWTEAEVANVRRRERQGGGIRLYLERPWFSSGDGELVGVLLRPTGFALMGKEAETLRKYTSEWGMDPLWHSAQTAPVVVGDFANAVTSKDDLALLELTTPQVTAVGFKPAFDTARGLWFVDIELSDRAYWPFVRLAVARFQPNSIDGVHLSSTVLTDFIQVAPHRTAQYDLTGVGPGGSVNVTLEGPGHAAGDWARNGATIVVARLEEREHGDAATTEPLGWTPTQTITLERTQDPDINVRWEGSLLLPDPLLKPLRVSILEAQVLRADGTQIADFLRYLDHARGEPTEPGAMLGAAHTAAFAGPMENYGTRIVFADATVVAQ